MGFFSIYTHIASSDRCTLWDWMSSSLLVVEWIIGGDFNMVEWARERDGCVDSVIVGLEE